MTVLARIYSHWTYQECVVSDYLLSICYSSQKFIDYILISETHKNNMVPKIQGKNSLQMGKNRTSIRLFNFTKLYLFQGTEA